MRREFDDVIATYTGTALNSFTAGPSVDDACNDLGAKVSLQVKAGVTVWIAIAGVEGGSGTFTVVAHAETVPPNDAFVDAVTLKPGRVQGSNTLATRELGEPAVAEGGGGSVWYRYRTNTRQRVTLDTSNSSFDTVLGVFTGDLGTLRKIASDDDGGVADTSLLSFTAVPRRTTGSSSTGTSPGAAASSSGCPTAASPATA